CTRDVGCSDRVRTAAPCGLTGARTIVHVLLAPDLRCIVEVIDLLGGQSKGQGPGIVRGLIGVLRTWNRQHILLLEQPSQGHLTWRFAVTITDQPQQCHYRLQCVKLRTAERLTKAADASRSAAIEIFPSQCTTCERLV